MARLLNVEALSDSRELATLGRAARGLDRRQRAALGVVLLDRHRIDGRAGTAGDGLIAAGRVDDVVGIVVDGPVGRANAVALVVVMRRAEDLLTRPRLSNW